MQSTQQISHIKMCHTNVCYTTSNDTFLRYINETKNTHLCIFLHHHTHTTTQRGAIIFEQNSKKEKTTKKKINKIKIIKRPKVAFAFRELFTISLLYISRFIFPFVSHTHSVKSKNYYKIFVMKSLLFFFQYYTYL